MQAVARGHVSERVVKWLVLARYMSPYMEKLWSALAATNGHQVEVAWVPRDDWVGFEHERGATANQAYSSTTLGSAAARARLIWAVARWRPDIAVVQGHVPALHLMTAAAMRAVVPAARLVYCADTNGLADNGSAGVVGVAKMLVKRNIVSAIFGTAFSLGHTNSVALKRLGLKNLVELPVLTVDEVALRESSEYPELRARPAPRLGVLARSAPEKNLDTLLDAWAETSSRIGGSLSIFGGGPLLEHIERRSRLLDNVFVDGPVPADRVGGVLRELDVLVLPSSAEPWGIVVLEALAVGVPVLATDVTGSAVSLLSNGIGGVRIVPPTREGLAQGLQQVVDEQRTLSMEAAVASPVIVSRYGIAAVAARLAAYGDAEKARQSA